VRALQAAVILMALVLVAGFATLFVRWGQRQAAVSAPSAVAPEPAVAADAVVPLPPGARVVQVAPGVAGAAGGPFVDVLVENPDGTRDLYRVRRADGAVAGTLRFRAAAP
jgi:hypothetical protein